MYLYHCRLLFDQYLTGSGLPFPYCTRLVTSDLHMPRKALLTSKHYSRKFLSTAGTLLT